MVSVGSAFPRLTTAYSFKSTEGHVETPKSTLITVAQEHAIIRICCTLAVIYEFFEGAFRINHPKVTSPIPKWQLKPTSACCAGPLSGSSHKKSQSYSTTRIWNISLFLSYWHAFLFFASYKGIQCFITVGKQLQTKWQESGLFFSDLKKETLSCGVLWSKKYSVRKQEKKNMLCVPETNLTVDRYS